MNVLHHTEQIERESNVDSRAVRKLIDRIFIISFDKVVEEHGVTVRRVFVEGTKLVRGHIEELVFFFAGAVGCDTVGHVDVDDSYHGHAMEVLFVDALGEVSHVVHHDEGVDVDLDSVDRRLDEGLDSLLAQVQY